MSSKCVVYTVAEVKAFLPDRNNLLLHKNLQSGMVLGTRGMILRYNFELQGASFFFCDTYSPIHTFFEWDSFSLHELYCLSSMK